MSNVLRIIIALVALGAFASWAYFWQSSTEIASWVVVLVLIVVSWISLAAGMAWERSVIPSIRIGSLTLDEPWTTFYVLVESTTSEKIVPHVWITRVTDLQGNRRGTGSYEAHWRSKEKGFVMELETEGTEWEAGLLGRSTREPSKNPALCVFDKNHDMYGITDDVPLEQQGQIIVHLLANCETKPDKNGNVERSRTIKRIFCVVPDPASRMGYKVQREILPETRSWWRRKS